MEYHHQFDIDKSGLNHLLGSETSKKIITHKKPKSLKSSYESMTQNISIYSTNNNIYFKLFNQNSAEIKED